MWQEGLRVNHQNRSTLNNQEIDIVRFVLKKAISLKLKVIIQQIAGTSLVMRVDILLLANPPHHHH